MKIIMDPRRVVAIVLVAASAACLKLPPATPLPAPPIEPAPVVIEGRDGEFEQTCRDVYQAVLERAIDASGAADCLARARRGETKEQLLAWLEASDERKQLLERKAREAEEREKNRPRFRGRLQKIGLRVVDAAGVEFTEPGIGPVALLSLESAEMRAWLEKNVVGRSFAIVRVFGGRLNWRTIQQSPADALRRLPALRAHTKELGIYLVIDAVTDSRDGGYDELAHVAAIAAQTAGDAHVLVLSANEPYHPSQSDRVQTMSSWCAEVRGVLAGYPNLWGLGAGPIDRSLDGRYAGDCGPISASHSERAGDLVANALRLGRIALDTGKPMLSTEPIGAGEVDEPGRRVANPALFGEIAFTQASLGVIGFFHSEDGLHARDLGPVQSAAATAFVEGYRRRPRATLALPDPERCSASDDPRAIVRCHRESWARMTPNDIRAFMEGIARDLNVAGVPGGPFGVLIKEEGTNCGGVSCDVICAGNGPAQRQWDVLGDAEGAQTAGFGELLDRTRMAIRPCKVIN